ncbi:putative leader peptide [Streptomyces triticagri]
MACAVILLRVNPDPRLVARWHVDLCRQSSALCAVRR